MCLLSRLGILSSVRALVSQHRSSPSSCLWHSRGTRSSLEHVRNRLRGTGADKVTISQRFWCSCGDDACPRFLRVFGEPDSDASVVSKWELACLDTVKRWARLYRGLVPKRRLVPSKPRVATATGMVPCPEDLVGTFVGKAGQTIRALERQLSARAVNRTTGKPYGHFNSRVVLSVSRDGLRSPATVSFVAPASRADAVAATIRRSIEALQKARHCRRQAYEERQVRKAQDRGLMMTMIMMTMIVDYDGRTFNMLVRR